MNKFNEEFEKIKIDEQKILDWMNTNYRCHYSNSKLFVKLTNINENDFFIINDDKNYNLIIEDRKIFRSDNFVEFLNVIDNMQNNSRQLFSKKDLNNLHLKTYDKWIKEDKKLLVLKFNFSNKLEFFTLMNSIAINNLSQSFLDGIFKNINIADGFYLKFSDEAGIMFVDPIKSTDNVIKHELIHFFQDVTGKGIIKEFEDETTELQKFIQIEKLAKDKKIDLCGITDSEVAKLIINKNEIIPYLNNLCYILEKNEIDKPLELINKLYMHFRELRKSGGTYQDFINYVHSIIALSGIDSSTLYLLMICFRYEQHISLIKQIVGNYFKDLKR